MSLGNLWIMYLQSKEKFDRVKKDLNEQCKYLLPLYDSKHFHDIAANNMDV